MYCRKCGKPNNNDNKYCENCGCELTPIKMDTGTKNFERQVAADSSIKQNGHSNKVYYSIGAIVIIALLILGITYIFGPGKKEPEELLEGTWTCSEETIEEAEEAYPGTEITFYADNTFTLPDSDGDVWISGDYALSGDTLRFTTRYAHGIRSTNEFVYTYSLNRDELTLSTNGESVTYAKQ